MKPKRNNKTSMRFRSKRNLYLSVLEQLNRHDYYGAYHSLNNVRDLFGRLPDSYNDLEGIFGQVNQSMKTEVILEKIVEKYCDEVVEVLILLWQEEFEQAKTLFTEIKNHNVSGKVITWPGESVNKVIPIINKLMTPKEEGQVDPFELIYKSIAYIHLLCPECQKARNFEDVYSKFYILEAYRMSFGLFNQINVIYSYLKTRDM